MIPPEIIDRIRERTSLAEIVGQAVKLERRGRSLLGLCPFHKERSPSFHVNDERGFYHCFGCHAAGDVFKFVQETEGLSFVEAVRQLGERAGIEVTQDLTDAERKQRAALKRREENLYQLNAQAAAFFEKMLRSHPHAELARDELVRRGLDPSGPAQEVLREFKVGYAPDGWDSLAAHLKGHGADLRQAESVGLIVPRKQGPGYYDRFRHRLMFAVLDLQGRIVAFSGRALPAVTPEAKEGEAPAKYINSPESPIYKKRETVFGLYQARAALRGGEPCLLVEGNFDVVSLHARGLRTAVAPLGTAFTTEQGKHIRRFTTDVVFLFDGDAAGRKAVRASRAPAQESGLRARVASLPEGLDPDDFSRKRGAEALTSLIGAARSMLDHLIAEILDERFSEADAHTRTRQVRELIEGEEDPTARALAKRYADQLAARLNVADAHTLSALENSVRVARAPGPDGAPRDAHLPRAAPARALSRSREHEIATSILGSLLDYPELLDSEELLAYSTIMQGDLAAAVALLRKAQGADARSSGARDAGLGRALAKLPDSIRAFAEQRVAAPQHTDVERARIELVSNLKKMQKLLLAQENRSTTLELERARAEGDLDREMELLRAQELRARQRRGL